MTHQESPLCKEFPQAVWLLLGNELPDADRSRWDRHLAGCEPCRRELADARAVLAAYRALPEQDAPETFIQAVVARAAGNRRWNWKGFVKGLRPHIRPRWLWGPALAGASLALFLLLSSESQRDTDLAWEPDGVEVTINRLDSTLAFYKEEVTPDTLQDETGGQLWDEASATLQIRIAALMQETEGSRF